MYIVSGPPAAAMRTRRESYPSPSDGITYTIRPLQQKKRRQVEGEDCGRPRKFARPPSARKHSSSGFDHLPEDLLIIILAALSATSTSPADLVNAMLVYVGSASCSLIALTQLFLIACHPFGLFALCLCLLPTMRSVFSRRFCGSSQNAAVLHVQ